MADLEIHAYNVGFGDAILVRVPRDTPTADSAFWTILIDGGNAFAKAGGDDGVLVDAMERIHDKTGGSLDLYIMTHEHLDHVQGPLLLKKRKEKTFTAKRVWMTSSSAPGYYQAHPEAEKKHLQTKNLLDIIERQKALLPMSDQSDLSLLLALNNHRSTQDCVDHIRDDMRDAEDGVDYIHAEVKKRTIGKSHGIRDVTIEVWAPEEDTSCYYGPIRPLTMAAAPGQSAATLEPAHPTPPAGVAMADFYRLVKSRDAGFFGNALMIDKAGNNSSIVFLLTWKGRRLLFAADAEERSWQHMRGRVALSKVDFLKISHHGSRNGTPDDLLDHLLGPPGSAPRTKTLVSTAEGQYGGVPDDGLLSALKQRSELHDTRDVPLGEALTLTITPL
ncbi:MAG: hypothetical protein HC871_06690 [Rhizobiales bacterium]|nr:hypothetical protein [Hyphomicrobiales bacterium]